MVKILEIFSVIFMPQMFFNFFQYFAFQKIRQPILAIPKMSRVNAKPTAALDTQIRVSRCIYNVYTIIHAVGTQVKNFLTFLNFFLHLKSGEKKV